MISHDRYFLDRVATQILAFEGNSQAHWFEGNFADYEEDKRKRFGDEASRPHRITYKKLTRAQSPFPAKFEWGKQQERSDPVRQRF